MTSYNCNYTVQVVLSITINGLPSSQSVLIAVTHTATPPVQSANQEQSICRQADANYILAKALPLHLPLFIKQKKIQIAPTANNTINVCSHNILFKKKCNSMSASSVTCRLDHPTATPCPKSLFIIIAICSHCRRRSRAGYRRLYRRRCRRWDN
jgi:hypothetical protein